MVPTVVNAIAGAEDTIDAMDLRAFGTSRRTWLRHLAYERLDWLVIACSSRACWSSSRRSAWMRDHDSQLWTPPFLIDLASN